MHRGRFIFAAALALATVSAQAATVINSDFTLTDPARPPVGWNANGTAGLDLSTTGPGPAISLALTHSEGSESGTAWSLLKARVPSFTMWADVNLTFALTIPDNCPADGFAMVFANTTAEAIGGGGGNLGLFGNGDLIPRFIGFEINTWRDQGINDRDACATDKFTTFAFDNANADSGYDRSPGTQGTADAGGAKIAQVEAPAGLKVLNGGWYRYQWNVDATAGTMSAYVTGLDDSNKAIQNMKLTDVKFTSSAPPLTGFAGRWGVTAATGGAVMTTRVAGIRVDVPAVAPGPPPAGN